MENSAVGVYYEPVLGAFRKPPFNQARKLILKSLTIKFITTLTLVGATVFAGCTGLVLLAQSNRWIAIAVYLPMFGLFVFMSAPVERIAKAITASKREWESCMTAAVYQKPFPPNETELQIAHTYSRVMVRHLELVPAKLLMWEGLAGRLKLSRDEKSLIRSLADQHDGCAKSLLATVKAALN